VSWRTALPWATTVAGAAVMYLAGRAQTRRLAWIIGLVNQVFWISYAVLANAHGFIVGSLIYASVYIRNLMQKDD